MGGRPDALAVMGVSPPRREKLAGCSAYSARKSRKGIFATPYSLHKFEMEFPKVLETFKLAPNRRANKSERYAEIESAARFILERTVKEAALRRQAAPAQPAELRLAAPVYVAPGAGADPLLEPRSADPVVVSLGGDEPETGRYEVSLV